MLIMEVADTDFLEELGCVPIGGSWRKKEIKLNTKLCYTQQKCGGLLCIYWMSVVKHRHLCWQIQYIGMCIVVWG